MSHGARANYRLLDRQVQPVPYVNMTNQSDRLIINELLCFLQCKVNVLDEEALLHICESFYSARDIDAAKDVILEATNQRSARRGDGKEKRVLKDLIKTLKETEPNILPTFVAKKLNHLPPVTYDYVDVSSLLQNILTLKEDVHRIQFDYVKTAAITEINEKLENFKVTSNESNRGSEEHSSDTVNKENITEKQQPKSGGKRKNKNKNRAVQIGNENKFQRQQPLTPAHSTPSDVISTDKKSSAPHKLTADLYKHKSATPAPSTTTTQETNYCLTSSPIRSAETNTNIFLETIINDDNFTTVIGRKNKFRDIRKKNNLGKATLTSDKIKIAPKLSYIYASRFESETTEENIRDFIEESGHTVVKVEKLKPYKETSFSSFKITIRQAFENHFLSEDFWPLGVEYRRYVFKQRFPQDRYTPADSKNEG